MGLLASLIGMKAGLFPQVLMLALHLVRTSTSLATGAEDGASLDRVCCTVDTPGGVGCFDTLSSVSVEQDTSIHPQPGSYALDIVS